jgi:hypothetical protein
VDSKVLPRVLIVWAAHTAASEDIPSWGEIGASAARALDAHQSLLTVSRINPSPVLRGLVLCSQFEAGSSRIAAEKEKLHMLTIPTAPGKWLDAAEVIALSLDDMLEKMIV